MMEVLSEYRFQLLLPVGALLLPLGVLVVCSVIDWFRNGK